MKKAEPGIRKRISIRKHFLNVVLLITIGSVLAASITGLISIRWIRSATEKNLTQGLETNLKEVMHEKVNSVDSMLGQYENYIRYIADYAGNMYKQEDEMIRTGKMFYAPVDTREYAITRAMASDDLTEEGLRSEILFFSHLEDVLDPIARENEGIIQTIYLGTRSGLLVSYDSFSYLSCPPEGQEVVYNYFASEWYRRGMEEDGIIYTGIYMDSQGRGLTMTIGSGFYDATGEPAGVVCLDFDLSVLYSDIFTTDMDNGAFTFALDHNGTIITADSDTLDITGYTGLTLDELDELRVDPDGVMEKEESVYVCIPLERMGWTLCASVPMTAIRKDINEADTSIRMAMIVFGIIVSLIILIAIFVVSKSVRTITLPLELLRDDIRIISDGDLSYRASVLRNDEIGDITSGMNEMVDRLNFTLNELMSSQQHADAMTRLAKVDSLTGLRNKTAFDGQKEILTQQLAEGEKCFGFAMLDLNNLKMINDNYGHDKGDHAIKRFCGVICEIFAHSPVFRIGGDEFVALLKGEDYGNIEKLVKQFKEQIRIISKEKDSEPWDRISAAIGYALYDEKVDDGPDSVLARADRDMYVCKKNMKSRK